MEMAELKSWIECAAEDKQEESNILWLHGYPGAGKSTVAFALAEELPAISWSTNENRLLTYLSCESASAS